jgi:predicted transcriptional regulator
MKTFKEAEIKKRNDKIKELRQKGYSISDIGKMFGITKQRVSQIVGFDGKRFHSDYMKERIQSNRIVKKCSYCGKEFITNKKRPKSFCSSDCYVKDRRFNLDYYKKKVGLLLNIINNGYDDYDFLKLFSKNSERYAFESIGRFFLKLFSNRNREIIKSKLKI